MPPSGRSARTRAAAWQQDEATSQRTFRRGYEGRTANWMSQRTTIITRLTRSTVDARSVGALGQVDISVNASRGLVVPLAQPAGRTRWPHTLAVYLGVRAAHPWRPSPGWSPQSCSKALTGGQEHIRFRSP